MILTRGKGTGGDKHVAESGGDPGGEREGEAGEAALTLEESELTEVEEVSYEPPAVAECAVIGEPHEMI